MRKTSASLSAADRDITDLIITATIPIRDMDITITIAPTTVPTITGITIMAILTVGITAGIGGTTMINR